MTDGIDFERVESPPMAPSVDRVRRNDALSFSDEVMAQNFIDQHFGNLRYTALRNKWYVWDGCRWRPDETLAHYSKIREFCYDEARVAQSKEAKGIASAGTVAAIERLARADQRTAVTIGEWDVDPWLLNTPAGTVDLRTGVMRRADPNDKITKITKITGISPDWNYPTPLWTGFLNTVTGSNPELIDYMQGIVGYALTGSTQEQALFFLYGTGANGKSTFINAITACIGDYHRTAPIETFTSSKNDRHPTELAGLVGARLVTAVETDEGRNWDEVKIKTLTGGDPVSARFMRGDFFEFTPSCTSGLRAKATLQRDGTSVEGSLASVSSRRTGEGDACDTLSYYRRRRARASTS
jgi:putative DNA primase/helicase